MTTKQNTKKSKMFGKNKKTNADKLYEQIMNEELDYAKDCAFIIKCFNEKKISLDEAIMWCEDLKNVELEALLVKDYSVARNHSEKKLIEAYYSVTRSRLDEINEVNIQVEYTIAYTKRHGISYTVVPVKGIKKVSVVGIY